MSISEPSGRWCDRLQALAGTETCQVTVMVEGSLKISDMPQLSTGWRHFQELHGRRHGDFKDRRVLVLLLLVALTAIDLGFVMSCSMTTLFENWMSTSKYARNLEKCGRKRFEHCHYGLAPSAT